MRRFYLQRDADVSGVSGTGRVAEGVEFGNGMCALSFTSPYPHVNVYANLRAVEQVTLGVDRGQLILADSPRQDLLFARLRVEVPGATSFHQRDRKRPGFGAHVDDHRAVRPSPKAMHLLVLRNEGVAHFVILSGVARVDDVLTRWAQKPQQGTSVVLLLCCE